MSFDLAKRVPPGDNRLWHITHQPTKQTKPVRLELRQRTITKREAHTPLSFTKLLGFIDTIADEKAIEDAAQELLVRAAQVDEFVGSYE